MAPSLLVDTNGHVKILDFGVALLTDSDAHATSAARYFEECLKHSEYWDVAVEAQTAENAPDRLLTFLAKFD